VQRQFQIILKKKLYRLDQIQKIIAIAARYYKIITVAQIISNFQPVFDGLIKLI